MEVIALPAKRSRIPGVPKWEAVEQFLARCSRRRDKAMLALMVYGGLRRAEVVRLNVGDHQPQFGLRRVLGKGGHETTAPLPEVARTLVNEYLAKERPGATASEPLFLVQYRWYADERKAVRGETRITMVAAAPILARRVGPQPRGKNQDSALKTLTRRQ